MIISKLQSITKNILSFLNETFKTEEHYALLIFGLTYAILLLGNFSSLKTLLPLLFVSCLLLNLRVKNILVSSFLMGLLMVPIHTPNKYYSTIILPGTKLLTENKDDYVLVYGLNIEDVFILFSVVVLLRNLISENGLRGKKARIFFKYSLLMLVGGLTFFTAGFLSSLLHSPYFGASIVWLLQYTELFVVGILVLYISLAAWNKLYLIYGVLLTSLMFESGLSVLQFMKQSDFGFSVEINKGTSFYQGLDEINTLYRPTGTFHFTAQLGMVVLLLLAFLLPYYISKKRFRTATFSILFSAITIVLTQARSVWLAAIGYILYFRVVIWNQVRKIVKHIDSWRIARYTIMFILAFSFILVPRLRLLTNVFYAGAGGSFRQQMLSEIVEPFIASPWIGYGVWTSEYTLYVFHPNGIISAFPAPVHNGFLQLLLETGIVGVGALTGTFLYALRRIHMLRLKSNSEVINYRRAFYGSILILSVYYLFQPHGMIEYPYLGLIMGIGFVVFSRHELTSPR